MERVADLTPFPTYRSVSPSDTGPLCLFFVILVVNSLVELAKATFLLTLQAQLVLSVGASRGCISVCIHVCLCIYHTPGVTAALQ